MTASVVSIASHRSRPQLPAVLSNSSIRRGLTILIVLIAAAITAQIGLSDPLTQDLGNRALSDLFSGDGLFGGVPTEDMTLGPAFYGPLLLPLAVPLARTSRTRDSGTIAFDGFYDGQFDEKRDRQRRYGEVYKLEDVGAGYLLRLEFPQRVPSSSVKEELGIPDEMPDYEYDLALTNGSFVVRGKVGDPQLRKVASGAPSFPPDFTTRITLASPVRGFKHRYRDKTLEVVLVK